MAGTLDHTEFRLSQGWPVKVITSVLSKVTAELREMDKAEAEREDARLEKLLEHNRKMMEW